MHTRRINGIALVDSDSSLFASVSEDTNVVLWRHSNGKLEVTETLSRHISSVHCVTTAGSFVFTAGGRAELCVWRIHECGNGNSSELIGFDKLGESDARYTGLTAFQESEMSMWVAATGSDGFLRVFYLNTEEKLLKLKFVSKPVDSCLMNVAVVLTGHSVLAVTIATNGNAFLYEFDITQEPTNEVRIDSKIIKVKPIDDKQQNQHISAVEHKEMELTWFGQLQKCSLTALAVRQSKGLKMKKFNGRCFSHSVISHFS